MAIHCALVLLIFVVPDVLITYLQPQRPGQYYLGVYGRTVGILIVFYINYLWLIPATLLKKPRKIWQFVLVNVLLVLVFLAMMYVMMNLMPHHHHRPRHGAPPDPGQWKPIFKMLPVLMRDFMAILLAIGLSVTLKLTESWAALERKNEEILAAQRTEEIQNLRSQLNPHSIFNTLNTIYALIDIDAEQAKKAVHKLSKLLRYMLYENPVTVELGKEVDFVRSYVDLMEMRLGPGKVYFGAKIYGCDNVPVAPLLFLPVVENAFKHAGNITPDSPIIIKITTSEGYIICTTENPSATSGDGRPGGIGLENLRRRLTLLYGDDFILNLTFKNGVCHSVVTIPLNAEQ